MLDTQKPICYVEGGFEYRMVREAPEGSYLRSVREVSKRNSKGRLCTYTQDVDSFFEQDVYQTLRLLSDVDSFIAAHMMSNIAQDGQTFYYMSQKFFKLSMVQFFRRDIDEEFLRIPILYFQFGFQEFLQNKVKSLLGGFEFKVPTFYSKQQYVDSFSYSEKQNNLNFDFFRDTFTYFPAVLSSMVGLFVIHRLVKLSRAKMNNDHHYKPIGQTKTIRQLHGGVGSNRNGTKFTQFTEHAQYDPPWITNHFKPQNHYDQKF